MKLEMLQDPGPFCAYHKKLDGISHVYW